MVVSSSNYRYVNRNLLDEPEYYKFSQFHGLDFLTDYEAVRQQTIKSLEGRYLNLLRSLESFDGRTEIDSLLSVIWLFSKKLELPLSQEFHDLHAAKIEKLREVGPFMELGAVKVPSFGDLDPISTPKVLSSLLLEILVRRNFDDQNIYDWLSCFLKRFEVTKKLFAMYTPQLKPTGSDDFKSLSNYALLSLCLTVYYANKKNLKMLNSALKINDLLVSTEADLVSPAELLFTIVSFKKEVQSVHALMHDKGIE